MKLLKRITDKDINGTDRISLAKPRLKARAVLLDEKGSMALMHITNFGIYVLPGGGVEEDEDLETALRREMLEETGCQIEIIQELGYIDENRLEHDDTLISNYWLAKVVGEIGSPQMTEEEIETGTQLQWHTPENALRLIKGWTPETYQQKFLQLRDIIVMNEAIEVFGRGGY